MAIDYRDGYVALSDALTDEGDNVLDYCDLNEDDSLADTIDQVLRKFIYFPPQHDYRFKILTSILFCSSRFSLKLGHILFQGVAGSGKSNALKVCQSIRGEKELVNPGSTAVGLRNWISKNKYWDAEKEKPKDTTFMGFNNVHANTFALNEKLSEMLQYGYDRASDLILIGGAEDGGNKEFHCFCLKGFSSVHALWRIPELSEIGRRLYIFPLEKASPELFQPLGEPAEFNWSPLSDRLTEFWWDIDRLNAFPRVRKSMRGSQTLWKGWDSAWKDISVCPIATGVVAGIWEDKKHAVADWLQYWQQCQELGSESPLAAHIRIYLEAIPAYERAVEFKEEWVLNPRQLKAHLTQLYDAGAIEERPFTKLLIPVMSEFNFSLEVPGWVFKPVS